MLREAKIISQRVRRAMRGEAHRSYGQVALAGEAARMASAARGTRYHTLGSSSYRLGRLIGAGELDTDQARAALWRAATVCGYVEEHGEATVRKEIESGLKAGALNPRSRQPRQEAQSGQGRDYDRESGRRTQRLAM
jgi:hypothetical protein